MSNYKNWKNKELGQNLAEHFGFKFRLDEGFGEGKPAKDEWSKKQEIEESEEEIDEVHYGGKQRPHRPGTPRGPDKCYDEEGTEIPCAELKEEEQELEESVQDLLHHFVVFLFGTQQILKKFYQITVCD